MEALDEDTKENIIRNIGEMFPDVSDLSFFRQVFDNENWDLEKSLETIKGFLEYVERDAPVNYSSTNDNFHLSSNSNDTLRRQSTPEPSREVERIPAVTSTSGIISVKAVDVFASSMPLAKTGAAPKKGASKKPGSAGKNVSVGSPNPKAFTNSGATSNPNSENKTAAMVSKASRKEQMLRAYNEVQKMDNPIHRITTYALENIRVMVIMRGCPGSGKTFLVRQLATNLSREQSKVQGSFQVNSVDHHIFSADDFWINPKTEKYVFNAEYLEYAHRWNQKLVRQAASEGRSPIFVDNTHTRLWEMQAAATIAVEFGYIIEIIEPPNRWRFNIDELVRRNSHGVHRDAIKRMVERYERHIKPSQLISAYRLNYPSNFHPPQRCLVTFSTPPSKNQTKIFNGRFHCVPLSQVLALKAEGSESSGSSGEQANANLKQVPQKQFIGGVQSKQPTTSVPDMHFGLFGSEVVDNKMKLPQFFPVGTHSNAQPIWFPQQNFDRDPSQLAVGSRASQFQPPTQGVDPNLNSMPRFWSSTQQEPDTVDSLLMLDEDISQNMPTQPLPHPERVSLPEVPVLPVRSEAGSRPRLLEDSNLQMETSTLSPKEPSDELLITFEEVTEKSLNPKQSGSSIARQESPEYESSVSPCDESPLDSDDTDTESCENLPLPQDACNEFGDRITPEYVLVGPGGKLTFQYAHERDPSFLKEFNSSSKLLSKANKLALAKTLKHLIGRQNSDPVGSASSSNFISKVSNVVRSPFKKKVGESNSFDDLVVPRGIDAIEAFNLSKSVSFPGTSIGGNDKPEDESVQDLKEDKSPEASFWDSLGGIPPSGATPLKTHQETVESGENGKGISSWNEKPENDAPMRPVRSKSPKHQRNTVNRTLARQKCESESNTNYKDFEVLTRVNAGVEVDPEYGTLVGNTFSFVSATAPPNFDCIKLVATHDKSSMTVSELATVVEKDSGVEILTKMFPNVSVDGLVDLFEKCHKDLDWTVNQMMDSGQEVCADFVADSSVRPEPFDIAQNPVCSSLDVEALEEFQHQATNSAPSSTRKNRKSKKLTEEYSDLVKEFESSFVVNEEYYSETLRKVKETKFGKAAENGPLDEPCGSRDSTPSNDQDTVSDILEDDEGDMSLVMSKDLISQLQSKFGPIPNSYGDDLVVKLPVGLARQIYSYALDSICQQVEEQQNVFDFLVKEDEAFARQLQEEPTESSDTPSFQEIMDHEVALRTYQNQLKASGAGGGGETFASKLSHQLLAERFPDLDPTSLQNVMDVTNHSLHEATNLLSFAGHVPVEPPPQESQKTSRDESTYEMSREESIDQANAYHEVAARLNDMRQLYFQKAKESYNNGNHAVALFYRELFNWYSDRIKESNSMAAKAMLYGNEGATTLDLHFLHVAEAVRVLDLFLDESIRRLSGRKLEIFIITGRGLHSADGKSRIKPAIKNRLKQRGLRFGEVNPGMLKTVITKTSTVSYKLNGVQ